MPGNVALNTGASIAGAGVKLLKSKVFWIVLGSIILIIIINKNRYKIKAWFKPIDIDLETGEKIHITDERKVELKKVASNIYTAIYSTLHTGRKLTFKAALALTENELDFMAKHYKQQVSGGNTLYEDVDNEWMPSTDLDEQLMAKLNKINRGQ